MATKTLEQAPDLQAKDDKETRPPDAISLIDLALARTVDRNFVSVGEYTDILLDVRNSLVSDAIAVEFLDVNAA